MLTAWKVSDPVSGAKVYWKWLVIGSKGECRVVSRNPKLKGNEIAYRLQVLMPNDWGRIAGQITINVPESKVEIVQEGFKMEDTM